MSPQDLLNKLHDEPFKPFRVRLSNSTAIDVLDPGSVVVGPTSAIMPLEYERDDRRNYHYSASSAQRRRSVGGTTS